MMKHASAPAFSLQRTLSSLKVSSADKGTQICTIPLQRLQDCHLVANRFILYTETNSPVIKLRKLPTGNLVQTLRLLSAVVRLEAAEGCFLAVMSDCTAVVRVEEKLELLKLEKHCSNACGAGALKKVGEDTLVCHLDNLPGCVTLQWLGSKSRRMTLVAHKNPISAIGLSVSGLRVATASTKGTLLRVFDTVSGKLIREVRMSFTCQQVTSLEFSPDDQVIGVGTSDGQVVLQEAGERPGLLGMMPSFLLPAWGGELRCATESEPVQQLAASWLEIE
jgi:WD40 repeat protein